ncbi:transposase [Rhodopseudomonas palustris]|uniref:transposase n=1 Tax=Rhodopseudomonas palustris TaxID=1076 RepID=UPI000E5AB7F3|nr:transposase [Rhodopseudomonas palustris]QLH71833.1 transposase [Rhodopseudomonas palustris]RIA01041.1 transposase [Rhodopseudomonas palustris]
MRPPLDFASSSVPRRASAGQHDVKRQHCPIHQVHQVVRLQSLPVREDRRKIQSPKRLVVMAVRERRLTGQTLTRVTPSENADCAWDMVRAHVSRKAHVYVDEHLAYDEICGLNSLTRVNHSEAYQHGFGVSTNIIESFFSRVRRSYRGIHHRFSMKYLDWYAAELAWREDRRRVGNGGHVLDMLKRTLAHPTSRNLCGYWQGNKPDDLVWTS